MHILVATDGVLDIDKTVELVGRMYESGDDVTVFTAIPFPRTFLQNYGEATGVDEVVKIAHEVGAGLGFSSGAKAAERLASSSKAKREAKPAPNPYFETVVKRCCGPLTEALGAAGIPA